MEAEKYADIFARCAITGQREELTKLASEFNKSAVLDMASLQAALANPAVRNSLIGAGAGGLLGLVQPKRKGINALQLALMGGLGGLGATYAFPDLFGSAGAAAAPAGAAAAGAAPALDPTKLTPERRAVRETGDGSPVSATAGGATVGALSGAKLTKGVAARSADRLGRFSADQLRTYAGSKGRDAKAMDKVLQQFASGPNRDANVNRFIATEARKAVPAGAKFKGVSPAFEQRMRSELDKLTGVIDRGRIDAVPFARGADARRLADVASRLTGNNVSAAGLKRDLINVQRPAGGPRRGFVPGMLRLLGTLGGATAGAGAGALGNQATVNYRRDQLQNRYEAEAAQAAASKKPALPPSPQVPAP